MPQHPVVLVFAGLDPSGGAGLQADIETLASLGCHAAPVMTANTVQNTRNVDNVYPTAGALVEAQARAVLDDMQVNAIKIGMLGHPENVLVIHDLLRKLPDIPVVLDPVLASGTGTALGTSETLDAMLELLIPLTTVLTPNSIEARALTPGIETREASARQLLDLGVKHVLITGTHEDTPEVINTLYDETHPGETFTWDRLPHSYHGSGCTLASAIAGLLARGLDTFTAINEAQEYTWNALNEGFRPGQGQHLPNRLFWSADG